MATKDDWYNNSNWSEEEQTAFFTRLKRAKDQKAFYVRAKGSNLLFSGEPDKIPAAIDLYRYGIEEFPDSDLLPSFYLLSAKACVALSQKQKAIELFKKTIEVQEDKTLFTRKTSVWMDYSLFVVRENLSDLYDEILDTIEHARIFLENEVFAKHALKAIIFQRQAKLEEAKEEKSLAEKSEFANNPKLRAADPEGMTDLIELLKSI